MDVTAARRTEEVPALLDAAAVDTSRPLLTYCDDATGERTELSVAELGGWVARTANLLVDGCRLNPGDRAAVLLPPHWQTAAVLLGAWSAGVSVAFHLAATAGLPRIGPGADLPADVTFVAHDRLDNWLEDVPEAEHQFVLGLAPGAEPMREVPAGYRDYLVEVREHGDSAPPYASVRPTDAATVDGTSYREWATVAQGIAESRDLRPGDRVLVDTAGQEQPVIWLLAPLFAGASVILCHNLAPGTAESRARTEGANRIF
ncbi:TIGR03089 family protein [Micromonospora sp. NBC_01796]|uniref:TIGR03089 family protein n=1 Tax=Micromonospora sp. NBC_01796 TaxID=2975987 RepID=UPI002DDAD81D|nr:TIGR03089 family protein [Micromonospora sp. NBC_01796]WSA86805.1 TIGR03089 family protein [Micromonospora sp. NBC_01796]